MRDETLAVHGGLEPGATDPGAVPIFQTVAHRLQSAEQAGQLFDLEIPGFHYNRLNNPTNDVLERRLAALEGGVGAVTVSSGAAAVYHAVRNLATAGSNIVSTRLLYGATYTLFAHVLKEEGIEARFSEDESVDAIASLIDENTRAVFFETVSNPATIVVDLEPLARAVHDKGVPLIADNTIATPLLLKPIAHGADVVVHSLTKFIGGHGTTLGGAIVDAGSFDWAAEPRRFPMMNEPELAFHQVSYARDFPGRAYIVRCRTVAMRNAGAALSPFNAFLVLQGLETLPVRLERQIANATTIARYLGQDHRVTWVRYGGLADHPSRGLIERYMAGRCPSILTFGVKGGYRSSIKFFDSVELFSRMLNMGDVKSLVVHPASTTHRQLGEADLLAAGISSDMVRLSIGLEHADDLIADIDQALDRATA
ncbi:MAG: O-acetylhomoserine aminocarboxypropyltransferase/cysteine synthase family protein [Acidimicrobiales bacterium]